MKQAERKSGAWERNRQGSGQGHLLVMLGEFVWKQQDSVWQAPLLRALDVLDVSENAARKAFHRLGKTGLLEFDRQGRNTSCRLTPLAHDALTKGFERVYGFKGSRTDWDGRWLVVSVTVPESQRNMRHFLKTRFEQARMGSPGPGLWISPDLDAPVSAIVKAAGLELQTSSFMGSFGPSGNEDEMVKAAWDLPALEILYRDFLSIYGNLQPTSDEQCFIAYVNIIQAWKRFPYLAPELPTRFLPSPWIGEEAVALLHDRREAWGVRARQFWKALQG